MVKLDVPKVLIDPGLDGIPSLSIIDLATFTAYAVYTTCLQVKGNWTPF